ncbi:MAG: hypothetical protein CVT65_04255 [Actinobacteria bacterium HGW-Actinobacteria-5]|nr:MAG: hypothetical protein CVT65_04255 [Actinobacteria bacterium HGW-Actinobacteria-5]
MAVATAPREPGRSGRATRIRNTPTVWRIGVTTVSNLPAIVRFPRAQAPGSQQEFALALTAADVARLGELARIRLTDEELAHLAPQLDVILASVARVTEVAGADVPPTSHALPLTNVFRDDVVIPSLPAEAVLAAAPAVEDGRFRVPRILGEEA